MTEAVKSNKNAGGRYFAPKPKQVACPYKVGQKKQMILEVEDA